jgi:hypothetical protein
MVRSHRSAADGVVSSAKPSGLNNFAELTIFAASRYRARASRPAALFRNGSIFFDCASTPPQLRRGVCAPTGCVKYIDALFKEGNIP